jgi:hypothetical protein
MIGECQTPKVSELDLKPGIFLGCRLGDEAGVELDLVVVRKYGGGDKVPDLHNLWLSAPKL